MKSAKLIYLAEGILESLEEHSSDIRYIIGTEVYVELGELIRGLKEIKWEQQIKTKKG